MQAKAKEQKQLKIVNDKVQTYTLHAQFSMHQSNNTVENNSDYC